MAAVFFEGTPPPRAWKGHADQPNVVKDAWSEQLALTHQISAHRKLEVCPVIGGLCTADGRKVIHGLMKQWSPKLTRICKLGCGKGEDGTAADTCACKTCCGNLPVSSVLSLLGQKPCYGKQHLSVAFAAWLHQGACFWSGPRLGMVTAKVFIGGWFRSAQLSTNPCAT